LFNTQATQLLNDIKKQTHRINEGLQSIDENAKRQEKRAKRFEKALLKLGEGCEDDSQKLTFGDNTSTAMESTQTERTENFDCMFTP
jgi:hypothetical protein